MGGRIARGRLHRGFRRPVRDPARLACTCRTTDVDVALVHPPPRRLVTGLRRDRSRAGRLAVAPSLRCRECFRPLSVLFGAGLASVFGRPLETVGRAWRRTVAVLLVGASMFIAAYVGAETPSAHWFGGGITQGPAGDNKVALTFDDGPNLTATLQVMRILEGAAADPQRVARQALAPRTARPADRRSCVRPLPVGALPNRADSK